MQRAVARVVYSRRDLYREPLRSHRLLGRVVGPRVRHSSVFAGSAGRAVIVRTNPAGRRVAWPVTAATWRGARELVYPRAGGVRADGVRTHGE